MFCPYCNGSFEGVPAFLGYFFPVDLIFLIGTNVLAKSVSGSTKLQTLPISPPRILIAFSDSLNSLSTFPDLYETNCPPIFTNGTQYSLNVDRLATARDVQRSYCSRYSFLWPKSSARPWHVSTFSKPNVFGGQSLPV